MAFLTKLFLNIHSTLSLLLDGLARGGVMVRNTLLTAACIACLSSLTVYADDEIEYCYAVADNDGINHSADILVTFDRATGLVNEIGATSTAHIEAIAFDPESSALYAADSGQLGVLDLINAAFIPLANPFGAGVGSEGHVVFDDVDGLTFDTLNNTLYGTQRHPNQKDLLFKINPITGERIADAFGLGVDYLVITGPSFDEIHNVDDLASDPTTGQLYASINIHGQQEHLVVIDKNTGISTVMGLIQRPNGSEVHDIEGLGFSVDGNLYGSTGNVENNTQSSLYLIDKVTASATEVGVFTAHRDYEGLDCLNGDFGGVQPAKCEVYAVHDRGLNDSQFIIAIPEDNTVNSLGGLHENVDVEGLDVHPVTDVLYATTGNDNEYAQKGHLFTVDANTGALTHIGATGFGAISGLAFNPVTNALWGFTDQKNGGTHGLVTIDTGTAIGTLEKATPNTKAHPDYKGIEALAWSTDGTILYAADDTRLWAYEAGVFSLQCDNFIAEVEALETLPNGHLAFTLHPNEFTDIHAYDPETCTFIEGQRFETTFNDIESIAWPSACGDLPLIDGGINGLEVQNLEALQEELNALLGITEVTIDEAGHLHIPITEGVRYVVRPDRQSSRAEEGASAGLFTTLGGGGVLESVTFIYEDEDEELREQVLHPGAVDEEALKAVITNALPNVQNVIILEDGTVKIKVAFQYFIGQLDFLVTSGGPVSATGDFALTADLNDDGVADYLITYPNGDQQILFYTGVELAP